MVVGWGMLRQEAGGLEVDSGRCWQASVAPEAGSGRAPEGGASGSRMMFSGRGGVRCAAVLSL